VALIVIFVLLIAGLGVKAALVPFHGWLPQAMVAPAPVSALLHAVAVVKAGAFGIVRVVDDVYGVEVAANLGVTAPLAVLAAVTIIYGSVRALFQDDLKRRLAFSTVSQVSYIVLGIAIVGPIATIGGLVHLVHQGVMKITLFFCAGAPGRDEDHSVFLRR
jgi:multicomponent Na+:H+ antiporter subunit D